MKYILKIINNKNIWNDFIIKSDFKFYSFVNSWEWGEFNLLEGNTIFRYGIYENEKLIGILQFIKIEAKRATYMFTPHGPLIKGNYFKILNSIKPDIKNIAKKEKVSFIRFNSTVINTKENKIKYENIGFINAPMHVHAEDTHILDLTQSEDDLMNNIKRKTRYLIRRAEQEGVQIKIDNSKQAIKEFTTRHQAHANRKNGKNTYHAFSLNYIKNLFKVFDKKDITLIKADYKGNTEASLVSIKFGKTCVYYLGVSDIKHPKFSPAYLLQWKAFIKAKSEGCTTYNFWGISPDNNPAHPIAGVTKFKRKFAGNDYSLLHAQDLKINNKYWLNYLIETIRRKKRGYYYKNPE